MARVLLTRSAIRHIQEVRRFSEERWGADVARQSIDAIVAALARIAEHPGILRPRPGIPPHLRCLIVGSHMIVADARLDDIVVVLGLWHGSMDIGEQLAKFEPTLSDEVRRIAERLERGERGSPRPIDDG